MSIPGLMVKVARHESISLRFQDETGAEHRWDQIDFELAELIQHEMDHLDGVLATDRALDANSLVAREQFLSNPSFYFGQVDHVIASYRQGHSQ
jgi:peptide deformylase